MFPAIWRRRNQIRLPVAACWLHFPGCDDDGGSYFWNVQQKMLQIERKVSRGRAPRGSAECDPVPCFAPSSSICFCEYFFLLFWLLFRRVLSDFLRFLCNFFPETLSLCVCVWVCVSMRVLKVVYLLVLVTSARCHC